MLVKISFSLSLTHTPYTRFRYTHCKYDCEYEIIWGFFPWHVLVQVVWGTFFFVRSFFGQFFYSLYTFQNFFNSASFSIEFACFFLLFDFFYDSAKKCVLSVSAFILWFGWEEQKKVSPFFDKFSLPNVFVIHLPFFNVWICIWQCQRGNRILCKIPFKTFLCQLSLKPLR